MLLPKIRTIAQLVIQILPLTFIVAFLIDFLSQHLRDQVVSWLMVGSHACICLGYLINALKDILHRVPRFLFLSDPSSMWLSLSPHMRARLFNPFPEISFGLALGDSYVETVCHDSHSSVAQVCQNVLKFCCLELATY